MAHSQTQTSGLQPNKLCLKYIPININYKQGHKYYEQLSNKYMHIKWISDSVGGILFGMKL